MGLQIVVICKGKIEFGSLRDYRGWLDASGGRCVDQGSNENLELIGFVLRRSQGKVKD